MPALTGLVHGLRAALLAAGAAALALRWAAPGQWTALSEPLVVSGVLATVAGHLSDVRARARRVAERQVFAQARELERQHRELQVLRASHALLSERSAAQEWSVAASVDAALRLVREGPALRSAESLLALLESQAMVRAGAVYLLAPGGYGLAQHPAATLGPLSRPTSHHPVVRAAFDSGDLVVPRREAESPHLDRNVLLAVPLVTSAGRVFGVVAVHELPFVATHDAHFRFIATLATRLADALRDHATEVATRAPSRSLTATLAGLLPGSLAPLPVARRRRSVSEPQLSRAATRRAPRRPTDSTVRAVGERTPSSDSLPRATGA